MDEGLFIWFEAPVDDEQLDQYAGLKKRLAVSIIPAGYNIYSPAFVRQGIKTDAWDAARFDATVVGGMGSLAGAVLGGFVVGVASVVFQIALPIELRPNRDVFVYGMVLLILLLRPSGLVKVKSIEEKV